jgi:hypothetical protein
MVKYLLHQDTDNLGHDIQCSGTQKRLQDLFAQCDADAKCTGIQLFGGQFGNTSWCTKNAHADLTARENLQYFQKVAPS